MCIFLNYSMDTMVSSLPVPSQSTILGQTRKCAVVLLYPMSRPVDEPSLKWKPPSENSIDFKLDVRFPPVDGDPAQPDFYAKPNFLLNTWRGGEEYDFFDMMDVDDDEWKKSVGYQYEASLGIIWC